MEPSDDPGVCSSDPPATVEEEHVRAVIEHSGTPAEVAAATGLTEHQVRLAIEYCERNPDALG